MAVQDLKGTWEEISLHAAELAGKTLRLTILPERLDDTPSADPMTSKDAVREALRKIMARQAGIREPAVFRLASTESTDRLDQ